jgi:hypothetical protein
VWAGDLAFIMIEMIAAIAVAIIISKVTSTIVRFLKNSAFENM